MLDRGVLVAFNAVTYLATVRFSGSLSSVVAGVPVSRDLAPADMVAGRRVAIAVFDAANPGDAMIVGVF